MISSRKFASLACLTIIAFTSVALAVTDSEIEPAISQSDDYLTHKSAFIAAARSLLESRRCTIAELKEMGGFVKSQSYKNQPIYFTYCGGMTIKNRIMLDVSTGRIFK